MPRDIDHIIEQLKAEVLGVQVTQVHVTHPDADDDGLWFVGILGRAEKVQIESSHGSCPFLIESDFGAERLQGHSVGEVGKRGRAKKRNESIKELRGCDEKWNRSRDSDRERRHSCRCIHSAKRPISERRAIAESRAKLIGRFAL
jgi:hypothetical protein